MLCLLLVTSFIAPSLSQDAGDPLRLTKGENDVLSIEARLPSGAGQWSAEQREAWRIVVSVRRPGASGMLGRSRFSDETLRFTPTYPFLKGAPYRAVLYNGEREMAKLDFEIPFEDVAPGRVVAVFPSSPLLPENQLKFYLHFSGPMKRGEAYRRIRLETLEGDRIDDPFLELGQELWDRDGVRFTLFIDPGRIKRGLKPREEAGPVLETGKSYRLIVDRQWPDSRGLPLARSFVKSFRVGEPDVTQPDPQRWRLTAPAVATDGPLRVAFEEPLDHALLQRLLTIVDSQGNALAGNLVIDQHQQRWSFLPDQPWKAGEYALRIDADLEDLAGNSIAKPFEVDVSGPVQREINRDIRELKFKVE